MRVYRRIQIRDPVHLFGTVLQVIRRDQNGSWVLITISNDRVTNKVDIIRYVQCKLMFIVYINPCPGNGGGGGKWPPARFLVKLAQL